MIDIVDSIFYLGKFLLRDADPVTIARAARNRYPNEMLQYSNPQMILPGLEEYFDKKSSLRWYVVVDERIISGKLKKVMEVGGLENFIGIIERGTKNTVVISFSKRDFRKVSAVIRSNGDTGWGTHTQIVGGINYTTHTYNRDAERAPPKYSPVIKQSPQPYK